MKRLCSACAVDDHRCLREFSCECEMCRRKKPKPTGDFSIVPFDASVLLEDTEMAR